MEISEETGGAARPSHIFVRASDKLLQTYIEPNRHELNCVSCVLRMLQLIDEETADDYSEKARGTVSGLPGGGAESILRELHGDQSIRYTPNFEINMQDAQPQGRKVKLDAKAFTRKGFNASDFSVKRRTTGSTDISRKGYILNIKVRGEDIPVYNHTYTQVYNGDIFEDYAGEPAELKIIGEASFRNRQAFISALKYIPEGCLGIGSLETGFFDAHRNKYRGAGVHHQIIIGKSLRGNPYIVDGQSGNHAQGIYRGLDAIYGYLKSGNYIHMRYLINDRVVAGESLCGSVDDSYVIKKRGDALLGFGGDLAMPAVRPFKDPGELRRASTLLSAAALPPTDLSVEVVSAPEPAAPQQITKANSAKNETDKEWKPDDSSSICPYCGVQFTFFYRRHHCRGCGNLCCGSCCDKTLHLLNSDGTRTEARVCGVCYRGADPSLKGAPTARGGGGGRYYKKRKSKRKTKCKRKTKRRRKSRRRRR